MNHAKESLAHDIQLARVRKGLSWADLATAIGKDPVWATAAMLGQHPMTPQDAGTVVSLLGLEDPDAALVLQMQPYRRAEPGVSSDPTIYRFQEALAVYGPAIKEIIHEEFGDGIMSAINFRLDVARRAHPSGDRVVVTFDGKFLDYAWEHDQPAGEK